MIPDRHWLWFPRLTRQCCGPLNFFLYFGRLEASRVTSRAGAKHRNKYLLPAKGLLARLASGPPTSFYFLVLSPSAPITSSKTLSTRDHLPEAIFTWKRLRPAGWLGSARIVAGSLVSTPGLRLLCHIMTLRWRYFFRLCVSWT